jgi:hypothetical protein
MSRQETNLNDTDLARDQGRFRRGTPLHSDLFPLRPPLRLVSRRLVIVLIFQVISLVLLVLVCCLVPSSYSR